MTFDHSADLSGELPDPRDQVDIQSLRTRQARALPIIPSPTASPSPSPTPTPTPGPGPGRPALNIFFRCSNTYTKAFRNQAGDAYLAICPKCGMTKKFVVGEGGTSQRTFTLTCE